VAALAALLGGATLFVERGFPVRSFRPLVVDLFVTGLAGIGTNIFRSVGRRRGLGFIAFVFIGRTRRRGCQRKQTSDSRQENPGSPEDLWSESRHDRTLSHTFLPAARRGFATCWADYRAFVD
jgi:hypothetical protein